MRFDEMCERIDGIEFSKFIEDEYGFVFRTRKGGHIVAYRNRGCTDGHLWGRMFILVGGMVEDFEVFIYRFNGAFLISKSGFGASFIFKDDGSAKFELCKDWKKEGEA